MTSCVVRLTVPVIIVVHTGLPALSVSVLYFITFCVSRRRRKMYCGHARLCVCVCVSLITPKPPHFVHFSTPVLY